MISEEKELVSLRRRLSEYKALINYYESHQHPLEKQLEETLDLLSKYQAWFTYHKTWTDRHNKLIKWNPDLNKPDLKGENWEEDIHSLQEFQL
jgi:hypothetical protein